MRLNYLFNRQLSPILPPDYGGSGWIRFQVEYSCIDNSGTNGRVRVHAISSSDFTDTITLTLHAGTIGSPAIATASVDLNVETEHVFEGVSDASPLYIKATGSTASTTDSITLSCSAVTQPGGTTGTNEIILEKLWVSQTYVGTDESDPTARGWIEHRGYQWKFNKDTETWYKSDLFKKTPVSDPAPEYYIVSSPFYGYCVPGTTTRRDFYYATGGVVTKKEDTKSAICGYTPVYGCTDPTATNYDPAATVDDGTCYFRSQVYGCTDPRATNYNASATDDDGTCVYAPESFTPVLHISPIASLRFVLTEVIDGCGTHQTLDNILFCQERFQNVKQVGYFQKVARCDTHPLQVLNNFTTLVMEVRNYRTDAVVDTITTEVKEQNTGDSEFYSAYLKNNTNGQTRIYFNQETIPVAVSTGDMVTIANSGISDGTFAIVGIHQDIKLGAPYIVINKPYTGTDLTTSADVRLSVDVLEYDVVEGIIDWSLYPAGTYYVQVTGTHAEAGTRTYTSEPVLLKDSHPGTLLIEYRNYDNAFDVTYTTGITHRIRVEAEIRKRVAGGNDEVHREPENKLTRLRGTVKRTVRLETRQLPPYIHERLAVVFRHDYIAINGVEYQSEEGYGEPEYTNSAYANATTVIEQVEWFKGHNDHDLGSINQAPLLIQNGGFLKL